MDEVNEVERLTEELRCARLALRELCSHADEVGARLTELILDVVAGREPDVDMATVSFRAYAELRALWSARWFREQREAAQ